MSSRAAGFVLLLLAVCTSRAQEPAVHGPPPDIARALERARSTQQWIPATRLAALQGIYRSRAFRPLWLTGALPTSEALSVLEVLRNAEDYGLMAQDYMTEPPPLLQPPGPGPANASARADRLAAFDVGLSAAVVRFLTDLHFGRIDARKAGFDLQFSRPSLNLGSLLERLCGAEDVRTVITSIEPPFYHYLLLRKSLARYRLLESGQAIPTPAERSTAPYSKRIRQIELTLERWRWLPAFDTPPIIVNIPQFRLFAFRSTVDRKADILQMDVIVGRTYPKLHTPIFAADLKYVIFRPYWDVPASITRSEMIPAIRARPDYLRRQHLEIVRGSGDAAAIVDLSPQALQELETGRLRLRQQPGADNALGLVKFMLPNPYNVYLHSTPAPGLFSQSRRAFSHGCIRVSDPVALAAYVLRDSPGNWTPQTILEAMQASRSSRVALARPIRVMILYGTALALEDGSTSFFQDIYGHDRRLERLLGLSPAGGP